MNETDSTLTLASDDQRIVLVFLGTPADSALNLVLRALMTEVLNTFYFLSLFQFLVVKLAFTH